MLHWMTQNIGMTVGMVVCLAGGVFFFIDFIIIGTRTRRLKKFIRMAQDENLTADERHRASIRAMEL